MRQRNEMCAQLEAGSRGLGEDKFGSGKENGEAKIWGSDKELEESECLGNMKEREAQLDTGEKTARKSPAMRMMETLMEALAYA